MAADYDWHPGTNTGGSVFKVETRNLGWWVFLAILVSIGIHIVLYFVLVRWEQKERQDETLNFRVATDQETIDRQTLEELLSKEPELPDNMEIVEPKDLENLDTNQDFDEFELLDALKDEPIRMAPIDAPEVYAKSMPKVPEQSLDMEASSMDLASEKVLSEDLNEMRRKLTENSQQISPDQVVLEIDTANDSEGGVNTDEFFKDAANKAFGAKADEYVKGYASLDSLINMTGGIKKGANYTAMLPTDILFKFGEATLMEESRLAMMKLAYLIEMNPDATFIIEGHTDSIGTDVANLDLSTRRAMAVRDWLVNRLRISPRNIRVIGKGEREPFVPVTGDADSEQLNRRVEIEIRRP